MIPYTFITRFIISGADTDIFLCAIYLLTGKTLLAKTLARIVNVPFIIADATSLTQASPSLINYHVV